MPTEIVKLPLDKQIEILTLYSEGADYRMFCRALCAVVQLHTGKRMLNLDAVNAIVLSAFKYKSSSHKVAVLREAYVCRRYIPNWHNLRDNTHNHAHLEYPDRARRMIAGLYGEVRNSVDGLWWAITPHFSYWNGCKHDRLWPTGR